MKQAAALSKKLSEALKASVETPKALTVSVAAAAATFTLLVLMSFPEYSFQLLAANPLYIGTALTALTANLYSSSGPIALALTVIYSLLGGSAVSNAAISLKTTGKGLANIAAVSPGLLASGCASCGVGFLGLLGFAGALASMPFQGNLIRLGGILLLVYFLARSGDPRKCEID